MEAELAFTDLVDSVSSDKVSVLSKERRYNFLKKCVRESDKYDPDKVYNTFKHLMRVVEEEYIRQMKKCIILRDMQNHESHAKYEGMKIPVRLPAVSAPYVGVIPIPVEAEGKEKFDYGALHDQMSNKHWCSDGSLVTMTKLLAQRCIQFMQYRYMNTNKAVLKLPKELSELKTIQKAHHEAVRQNISVQWREYLVGDIQDILKGPHNFYESNFEIYKETALKRIITRFELILHTYLREFVQNSINDWVSFIKSFTLPDYAGKNELWRYAEEPMIIIHLHVNQPKRSKEKKERKGKNDRDSPNKTRDEEEEKLYVDYKPTL